MGLFRKPTIKSAPVEFDKKAVKDLKRLLGVMVNAGWSIWHLMEQNPDIKAHAKEFAKAQVSPLMRIPMPGMGGMNNAITVVENLMADPLGKELAEHIVKQLEGLGVFLPKAKNED